MAEISTYFLTGTRFIFYLFFIQRNRYCIWTECREMGALNFCVMKEKLIAIVLCELPRDDPGSLIVPRHQEEAFQREREWGGREARDVNKLLSHLQPVIWPEPSAPLVFCQSWRAQHPP